MTLRGKAGTALFRAGALAILALAIPGSSSGDVVLCEGIPADITGTPDNDQIYGTTHEDVIFAGSGRDEVHARAGDDFVCGGPGADLLVGGNDQDRLNGDDGNDDIFGKAGSDYMDGEADHDLCDGGKPTRPEHHPSDPDRATGNCEQIVDALVIH